MVARASGGRGAGQRTPEAALCSMSPGDQSHSQDQDTVTVCREVFDTEASQPTDKGRQCYCLLSVFSAVASVTIA